LFEAQLRHTDLEWNDASLRLPLIVRKPWWQSPAAQVGAGGLAAVLAALAAWQIARRRLARQLAELERRQELDRERARIARDMHDNVGARLTQLTVMHELFAAQHPVSESALGQLNELTTTARAAVAALDEAVWAVNPRNDTLQNVADYLCHAAVDYLTPLKIACRQRVPDARPEREVGAQKRHEHFIAFKEALQNVVKHAGATEVILTLRFSSPDLIIYVDDNGRGLDTELAGIGKDGLLNLSTRLSSVGGSCEVASRKEGGTRVEIRITI
jgi:signal transduction histidine kinase